jgi:CRISPR/Cas system CSM-associated protein Csm3 (group 7 of RAMP superfamily)
MDAEIECARNFIEIEFTLCGAGPLLTNDTTITALAGTDHAPALAQLPPRASQDMEHLSAEERQPTPFLPGTSLRGSLRARAERIARTLATLHAARTYPSDSARTHFIKTCPACNPVESRWDAPLANCDALLTQYRVTRAQDGQLVDEQAEVEDAHLCLACRLFGSTRRGSRLSVQDAHWHGELPPKWWKIQDFVAIDRFTGGALDSAKFDALAVMNPRLRARLRIENPRAWELGWLVLVLRDLHDGLIPLGWGASKGYGQVSAQDWQVQIGALTPSDRLFESMEWDETPERGMYDLLICREVDWMNHPEWATQLRAWLNAFYAELQTVQRGGETQLPLLERDTYFGERAQTLYPLWEVENG